MEFAGKKVVVTGGTGSLGRAVVDSVLKEGAEVWVPVRGEKPAKASEGVRFVEGIDLANETQVEAFYRQVGPLWASVHTAGGFAMSRIAETKLADFVKMLETNAVSAFLCSREAVKPMRAAGGGGRIVNVAAKPALHPVGGMIPYAASKAAVLSITQSLAEELAAEKIWVNAVVPSVMDTPQNRASFPAGTDFSRWPTVEEVARTVLFLASPENRVTRGAAVPVYGRS
ncbi:MAG: SDR family NAD(P)-dependent oxidoreductase [Phycisphaerae bacterium]